MNALVRDVMSTYPMSVRQNSSFKELAVRFRAGQVSAFVVLDDDGKVIGVVSDADMLLKEALDGEADGRHGLMTSPAVTVAPDDTVAHAAGLMYDRRLRQLPVVDAAGRLAGIINRTDVLAVFDRPDEEIRVEIISRVIPVLSEPSWYSVIVKDGIVTLEGTPETDSIGHTVLTRVRHVQGVVAVRDRLVYPALPVPVSPGCYS